MEAFLRGVRGSQRVYKALRHVIVIIQTSGVFKLPNLQLLLHLLFLFDCDEFAGTMMQILHIPTSKNNKPVSWRIRRYMIKMVSLTLT